MSKCPVDYKWVKVPRNLIPTKCKGIMKDYFKIAFASAYKDGIIHYCGYENEVKAKQFFCGIVGLKRLLQRKSKDASLDALFLLSDWEFVSVFAEPYRVTVTVPDIILPQTCSLKKRVMNDTEKYIAEHRNDLDAYDIDYLYRCAIDYQEKCYVSDGSGYICIPRNLTERLVKKHYIFDDADAFYDLYLHTVDRHEKNPFSERCPTVMYEKGVSVFTLDYLCNRWGWNKSKVSRFFKKFSDYFSLVKLQSSYGCVIFNKVFQTDFEFSVPTQEDCFAIVNEMKFRSKYFGAYEELMYYSEYDFSENDYINCIINNFMFYNPEEEARKMAQDLANFDARQNIKNTTTDSENEKLLPTFGNYFFDLQKCVLQFSPYNNTLVDIHFFNRVNISARNILSNHKCSSNKTFNCENSVCPKCRTAFQWARPYECRIRSPILASVTQISPIIESDARRLKFPYTAEASNASPSQKSGVPKIESSPTKLLRILLKSKVAKLYSKIKYLVKGVKNYE